MNESKGIVCQAQIIFNDFLLREWVNFNILV